MEFVYEKIFVPNKHSFITRQLKMDPNSEKIHSHKNYELNLITSGSGRRIVGNHISSYNTFRFVVFVELKHFPAV